MAHWNNVNMYYTSYKLMQLHICNLGSQANYRFLMAFNTLMQTGFFYFPYLEVLSYSNDLTLQKLSSIFHGWVIEWSAESAKYSNLKNKFNSFIVLAEATSLPLQTSLWRTSRDLLIAMNSSCCTCQPSASLNFQSHLPKIVHIIAEFLFH